jgi:serine/threonine protein kinase
MVGRTISHYLITDKLGEGGMGVVYKARDTRLDRVLAVKILPPGKVADAERKRRFVKEAKAASALNHPNIVTIYDIDEQDGMDFIAMEFVPGQTLDRLITRQGMPPSEVLRYAVQIAGALSAAHAAGIVHRDLKPGNIMVADSGLVKVLDFGLAKLTENTTATEDGRTETLIAKADTAEGVILGTIAYMSPEQAQGLKLDARSDIFSLGALLYEMLTGRRAFSGDNKVSTLAAILIREPEALAETTPREMDRIVTRCLRKDPARRFQNMADLKVALEELKEESESGRLAPVAPPPPPKPRWRLAAAALAIAALVSAGGWSVYTSHTTPVVQNRNLRQLTFDPGESSNPTLSPDAKLVAYESDRAGPGRHDIWVQQTSGGPPLRLTKGPGDHRMPVFSAEGSKIYFQSTGPPQGIYEVSALGGEPRLLAPNGRGPNVSPDGRYISFITIPAQELSIVSQSGGDPRVVTPGFYVRTASKPLWTPDSQQLVFYGQKGPQPETREFWVIRISDGTTQQLDWAHWAVEHRYFGFPSAFLSSDSGLASLGTRAAETTQIYRFKLARGGWKVLGEVEPLTSGAAWSRNPSVAAGKIAFQSGEPESGLWSLPADTNQGRVTGSLTKITAEKAVYRNPSLTRDGKMLAFSSNRTGSMDVLLRDLTSGEERPLTTEAPDKSKRYAQIDPTGTQVVYTMYDSAMAQEVYAIAPQGGSKRKICDDCGPSLSLSPDGQHMLAGREDRGRSHINLVNLSSGKSTQLLYHSKYGLDGCTFSPDGKWISFLMTKGAGTIDAILAPFRGATPVPEQDWITVTPAPSNVIQVFWSPDGRLIYYIVNLGSSAYLMARHLDPSHQPTGAPFRVYEFGGRVRPPDFSEVLTAAPGRFIGVLSEDHYNIWMMDLPK